jgi:hypothetical protein
MRTERRRSGAIVGWVCALIPVIMGFHVSVAAQQKSSLVPTPRVVSVAESSDLSKFDKQLIQLPAVRVIHSDTAQAFMFGDKSHPVHVIIPAPAIDAARVGDTVEITGIVRRYSPREFEQEYRWFHEPDYQDIHSNDWVIVATSVRTQEGSQLVPGSTISTLPPNTPKTKPEDKH